MIDTKTWTGERLETFVHNDTTFEHLHRYALALEQSSGKKVLDVACGEGYGAYLMAGLAAEVTGVDISQETIDTAAQKYKKNNLRFMQGEAAAIPCPDGYFDLVVSFETIEHHDRHMEMMQEIKRVLKKEGILIISSPDKRFYSDKPGSYQNPFHVKELYKEEFQQLLQQYFTTVQLYSQSSFIGSVVVADEATAATPKWYDGNYEQITTILPEAPYSIAVAADRPLPASTGSFFKSSTLLEQRLQNVEQEMHRSFTQQLTDYVTYQVTDRVAKEVTRQVTQDVQLQTEERLRSSKPYRIGEAILNPFQYLSKVFKSK